MSTFYNVNNGEKPFEQDAKYADLAVNMQFSMELSEPTTIELLQKTDRTSKIPLDLKTSREMNTSKEVQVIMSREGSS